MKKKKKSYTVNDVMTAKDSCACWGESFTVVPHPLYIVVGDIFSLYFFFHPEENGLSSFNKEGVKDGRKQGLLGAFRVRSDSVSKKITHGVRCLVISDATIPFFKKILLLLSSLSSKHSTTCIESLWRMKSPSRSSLLHPFDVFIVFFGNMLLSSTPYVIYCFPISHDTKCFTGDGIHQEDFFPRMKTKQSLKSFYLPIYY